ncbi:MAG TPA: protein kinase [Polyangiaceae bacterium]|nr:protein kinase [Polyangiaceae bacterium]
MASEGGSSGASGDGQRSDESSSAGDVLREVAFAPAVPPPAPKHDRSGERLDRFLLTGLLGRGGMGEVYAALDLTLRRKVALKLLHAEAVGDAERRRRLAREARAAAAVSHPNIAAVFEVGDVEGEVFIALELVEGRSLRASLRQAGAPLPAPEAARIAREIARGLAAAHAAGVVHRDVKPENVMLGHDGRVKVLDFGLAKLHSGPSAPDAPTASAVATRAGQILGSPGYMAPEQARGQPTDARSDVFSCGVVLFEMLAGVRPFQGPTAMDVLTAILRDAPPPLDGAPPALAGVVARCLAKEPGERYADAGALLAALEAADTPEALTPEHLSRPPSRLRSSPPPAGSKVAAGPSHGLRRGGAALGTLAVTAAAVLSLRATRAFEYVPSPPTPSSSIEAPATPTAPPPTRLPAPVLPPVLPPAPPPAPGPTAITDLPPPRSPSKKAVKAYRAALRFFRSADWSRARENLRRAIAFDPDLAAAHLRLAITRPGLDRPFDGSIAEVYEAYAAAVHRRNLLTPRDRGLLEALEPAMRAGAPNMAETVRRLTGLAEAYSSDAELWQILAIYSSFSSPESQLAAAKRAIECDDQYADAWQMKGTGLARQRSNEAKIAYEQCLEIAPRSPDCLRAVAVAESRLGRCADAEGFLRSQTRDDPDSLSELAGLLYQRNESTEAVHTVLRRKWKLYPSNVAREEEHYDRALLAAAYGDFDSARKWAGEEADSRANLQPSLSTQARFALLRADIELEVALPESAASIALDFLKRRDGWSKLDGPMWSSDPTVYLARIAARAGKLSEADVRERRNVWNEEKAPSTALEKAWAWWLTYTQGIERKEEADEALARWPADASRSELYAWMDESAGRALWLGGKLDEALPYLKQSFERCDQFSTILSAMRTKFLYGQALEKHGEREEACRVYGVILERWGAAKPLSVTAERARERVGALGCGGPR